MKKIIDIDPKVVTKLKLLAALEDQSVKALMEKAVSFFVAHKEKERLDAFSAEEKEDLGLLLLLQQADTEETVSEEEVFKVLDS
jgi:predicted transcriptional regulator